METVLLLIRIFLFGVFALAGIGKLMDPAGSRKAVTEFGVPSSFVPFAALALPIVELLIAALFLFNATSWFAAIVGLLLLLIFIGGMIHMLARGKAPDCHCFGQIHSEPVGRSSIIRSVGFAALALVLAIQGSGGQGLALAESPAESIQTLLIITCLLLSVTLLFFVKKLSDQFAQFSGRLESIGSFEGGSPAVRENAGDPADGLPIGAPFPDFELPSASGKAVRFEHLLSRVRPLMLIFVSPECGPCRALFPEIQEWCSEFAEKMDIFLISSGEPDENLSKFAGFEGDRLLLQQKRELAELVHARWTPTAIVVGTDGSIASHPAAGDRAIRELAERIKASDLSRPFTFFANPAIRRAIKIGSRIPKFELTDINGRQWTENDLIGEPALVIAWSLACPHCVEMADEIKKWESERLDGGRRIFILADGDADEFRSYGFQSPVIIDVRHIKAINFGLFGTPSAVLVNAEGVVTTEAGIGSPNIRALLGK